MGSVAKRPACRRPSAGFTLVEILVVVVILAIAAGVATVAYQSSDRDRALREARRFASALEYAALRAQTRAETLGASADGNSWRFWRQDRETGYWAPVTDDEVLVARAMPSEMTLSPVDYAGQALGMNDIVPLRSSGRNDPFTFLLQSRDARVVLAADPLNRVALVVTSP